MDKSYLLDIIHGLVTGSIKVQNAVRVTDPEKEETLEITADDGTIICFGVEHTDPDEGGLFHVVQSSQN